MLPLMLTSDLLTTLNCWLMVGLSSCIRNENRIKKEVYHLTPIPLGLKEIKWGIEKVYTFFLCVIKQMYTNFLGLTLYVNVNKKIPFSSLSWTMLSLVVLIFVVNITSAGIWAEYWGTSLNIRVSVLWRYGLPRLQWMLVSSMRSQRMSVTSSARPTKEKIELKFKLSQAKYAGSPMLDTVTFINISRFSPSSKQYDDELQWATTRMHRAETITEMMNGAWLEYWHVSLALRC